MNSSWKQRHGTFRHQCQNTATVPRQRDDKHLFLWIAVDKEPVTRTRVRSGTRKFRGAIGSGRRLTPRGRGRILGAPGRTLARSKIEAVVLRQSLERRLGSG